MEEILFLSTECPDNIPDGVPAKWTLSSSRPLLCGTLVAHAHVATGVEDTVYSIVTADQTFFRGYQGIRKTRLWAGC